MSRLTERRQNKRRACATLLAFALSMTNANAQARDNAKEARRPTSGEGVPAWVIRECRPATGAEMLARIAGPGQWFYRGSDDYCYFDTRPGVM